MNIAVLPGDVLLTVVQTEDGYEIGGMRGAVFMAELLKHTEFLRRGEEKAERGKWQHIDENEWGKVLEDIEGAILLREYSIGKTESEKLYFWKEGTGYLLHKTRGRIRTLSPGVMRKQIYRILEEEKIDGE